MANEGNLIPKTTLSKEEAKTMGRLGGIASVKSKRKNKLFKETIEWALSLKCQKKAGEVIKKAFALKDVELNNQDAMVLSQVNKAITKSDTQAFNAITDRLEGKPLQKTENKNENTSVELIEDLSTEALKELTKKGLITE